MPSSRESSQPRDQTQVSGIAGGFFTKTAGKPKIRLAIIKNKQTTTKKKKKKLFFFPSSPKVAYL